MFERMDAAAKRVIHRAVAAARLDGAHDVLEEHLALALFDDPESGARRLAGEVDIEALREAFARARRRGGVSDVDAAALRDLGIDVDEIVRATEAGLGTNVLGHRRPRRNPRFSKGAADTIGHMVREAVLRKQRVMGTAHLLLGLLRPGGFSTGVFQSLGVRYDEVAAHL